MIEWFAGLIDGEGCFYFQIYVRQDKRAITVIPKFSIAMSDGDWISPVKTILTEHQIPFSIREHRHIQELSVRGFNSVKKLCAILLPYCVVKKPALQLMLNHKQRKQGNRFVPVDPCDIDRIAKDVDFMRSFNRKRNVPYVWDGQVIRKWYSDNLGIKFPPL